jgi:hypothetical protein
VRDSVFRDDLMVLATGDLPLWDGVTDIEVRHPCPDEEAKWWASRARAIRLGNIKGNDRLCGRIAIRRGLSAGCGGSWQARPR